MSSIESKQLQSASAFSYAQAAKGSAAAKAAATLSSQETSGTTTPAKDVSFASEAQVDFTTVGGSAEAGKTNGGEVKITGTDRETYKYTANIPASISSSIPTSPRHGSTSPKEETISASQLSTDWREGRPKQSEHNERRERGEDRKKRKGKKKEVAEETEPEEPKPVEILVAAPPPAVNIWQQRMTQAPKKVVVAEAIVTAPAAEPASEPKTEKKKSKSKGAADSERPIDLKSQTPKKDASSSKDEGKRSAPRGSRQNEKDEKAASAALPPPVEDAMLWPTPEIAIEKIKAQEKADKEEKAAEASSADKQPRAKQAWVTVPYTPSVTFSTPLPGQGRGPRGERGRGGGRERGHGREGSGGRAGPSSSGAGEKTILSASTNATPDSRERGRNSVSSGRASSLPVEASKRNPDFTNREARKTFDKPAPASQAEPRISADASHSSTTSEATTATTAPIAQTPTFQQAEHANGVSAEAHGHPQGQTAEIRPELNARSAEFRQDAAGHHGQYRGRGARGGRGNHHFTNGGHMYANGQPQQPLNGFAMRPNGYSPPQAQQYAAGFAQRGRGGGLGRTGSITGAPVYQQRYPGNPVGAPGMEPLQTNMMYGYPPVMSMSSVTYNQYAEQYSVVPLVVAQLDYYFSIDNLCKDLYLRKHMDSQGFVFLHFVAGFKRIQSLMNGDLNLLKVACEQSQVVELVVGEDGLDRIRRADGWDKWILPIEDRDESAKNAGPSQYFRHQYQLYPQQYPGMMPMPQGQQGVPQPQMYQNGTQSFHGYPDQQMAPMNGQENGYAQSQHHESPINAAAPEFAPEQSQPQVFNIADYADADITFADEEIPKLTVVYTEKAVNEPKSRPPFVNASQRTFSNGSIDSHLITEELAELERRRAAGHSNGGSEASDM